MAGIISFIIIKKDIQPKMFIFVKKKLGVCMGWLNF